MLRKKLKRIIAFGLLATSLIGGGIFFYNRNKVAPHTYHDVVDTIKNDKVTQESIVEELKENLNVNVLDICMRTKTTIDKTPASILGAFDRKKEVTFYGQVSYSININNIKRESIEVEGNSIRVYLSNPEVKAIINQEKTEFCTKLGYLAFGDVVCTPEEVVSLENTCKDHMIKEGLKPENMNEAKQRVNEKIESLLNTFTRENYQVKVIWV